MNIHDFFLTQYDYIYFFYGLSFFFLGVVGLNLAKRDALGLPWVLLGFFGLAHAFSDWVEIAIINFGEYWFLPLISLTLLFISYIFLLEFARIGLRRSRKKRLPWWIYLILGPLAFWGSRYGVNGMEATVRCFLGFPSAVLCAWVIFDQARKEPRSKRALIILSLAIALYSLFAGFIVPPSDFLLGKVMSAGIFYNVFKLPVQLIRGMVALMAAAALWFYTPILPHIAIRPRRFLFRLRPTKLLIMVTLVGLIALGWVFTAYLDYQAGIQIIKKSEPGKAAPVNQLLTEVKKLEKNSAYLSRAVPVRAVLALLDTQNFDEALKFLKSYQEKFPTQEYFVLDKNGSLVISTSDNALHNVTDKTHVTAPYFKDAMKGETGYYFVPGLSYAQRDYYVSSPIRGAGNEIIGAAVVKDTISAEPVLHYRLISITVTLFVCLLAISFFLALGRKEDMIKAIETAHEQLQVLDEMKSDFVAVVSHELKTPLTSIKNAATVLLKDSPDRLPLAPRQKELLEIIVNNTNRQIVMVNDLLDISKIEAGTIPIYKEEVNMVALAKEAINLLSVKSKARNITVNLFVERETICAFADKGQTRRILVNLVSNAIKFSSENSAVAVKLNDLGNNVQVSVSDNGIGISAEDKEKLFNKFYRASDMRAREKGGSGLGLVIVKGLIDAQGGKIWVESELNKGSTFFFTLPTEHPVKCVA